MDVSLKAHPGKLQTFLSQPIFSYANVPYRIKPYADLQKDPFNTIDTVLSLESAIKQLPQEQVVAIQMYFFQQLDQKEASLMLGITQGAFSKRLSKALQQLKTILGDDFLFD